jgi:glutaredoxin
MAFTFLLRWLRLAPKQRPDVRVIVFTRATCPLCEEAWELLQRQQRRYGFTLEAKDIDESAELVREHGEWVPVVAINGQVRFRGHVNEVLLRRILDRPA